MNAKLICATIIFWLGFAAHLALAQQSQAELAFKNLAKQSQCDHAQRKDYVIRTQADWEKLYKQISGEPFNRKRAHPDSTLLKIDFAKQMLIAVFQGQKPSGGYSIEITKLLRTDKQIEAMITETSPGSSCFTTQALTHPYHLIVTEKSDRKVVFTRRQVTTTCD